MSEEGGACDEVAAMVLASSGMPNPDSLEQLTADWEALARYSVVRNQREHPDAVLAEHLTLREAREFERNATQALAREPGYRPYVMSRPLILIQLEEPEATNERYRALRARRASSLAISTERIAP